jgi:ABC-2 type transport system permease protein
VSGIRDRGHYSLNQLRADRAKQFRKWVLPYLRLVGGSLPGILFTSLAVLLVYNRAVDELPDTFPAVLATAIILTFAMRSVWIRTYLVEADLVYLLPLEHRMSSYLRACLRSALFIQLLKISFYWALLWQLYRVGPGTEDQSFLITGLLLLLIKLLTIYYWWVETKIRNRYTRLLVNLARTIYLFLLIYATLTLQPALVCLILGLSAIGYILLLAIPGKSIVAWERLIELEQRRRMQWIRLLRQFVEVENETSSVRSSPFAKLASRMPHHRAWAYRYVYLLIWSRSPISRITQSLLAVGCVILVILDVWWLKSAVLLFVLFALRLQLKELSHYHQYKDWSFILPIREESGVSAKLVARGVWIVCACILLLVSSLDYWVY